MSNCLNYLKSLGGNIPPGYNQSNWGCNNSGGIPVNLLITTSANGAYKFFLQNDANLVIYNNSNPIWALNWISGIPNANCGNAGYITFQSDGNLVYYFWNNSPVWASNVWGTAGYILDNDGGLKAYNSSCQVTWSTNGSTNIAGLQLLSTISPSLNCNYGNQTIPTNVTSSGVITAPNNYQPQSNQGNCQNWLNSTFTSGTFNCPNGPSTNAQCQQLYNSLGLKSFGQLGFTSDSNVIPNETIASEQNGYKYTCASYDGVNCVTNPNFAFQPL